MLYRDWIVETARKFNSPVAPQSACLLLFATSSISRNGAKDTVDNRTGWTTQFNRPNARVGAGLVADGETEAGT